MPGGRGGPPHIGDLWVPRAIVLDNLKSKHSEPVLFLPRLAGAFQSTGSADLSSFGGMSVGWPPDLLCWLPVYDRAEMRLVYLLIVGLTDFLSIFCISVNKNEIGHFLTKLRPFP
jgi:hypothetical protein